MAPRELDHSPLKTLDHHKRSSISTKSVTFTSDSKTQSIPNPTGKSTHKHRSLMQPNSFALAHPAAISLSHYATIGCPVDITAEWSLDQLDDAVRHGAHSSARTKDAAACI